MPSKNKPLKKSAGQSVKKVDKVFKLLSHQNTFYAKALIDYDSKSA